MKKFVKLILALIIVYPLAGIIMSACSNESDCSIAGRPMLNCNTFRIKGTQVVKDSLDSLTVTSIGTDSVIINNQKTVTDFSLPLRYTKDTTTLVFHYSKNIRDTLTIKHSNTPKFVSVECGYEMKQAILKLTYTRHKLDSIRIISNSTNTDGTRNLALFYR